MTPLPLSALIIGFSIIVGLSIIVAWMVRETIRIRRSRSPFYGLPRNPPGEADQFAELIARDLRRPR